MKKYFVLILIGFVFVVYGKDDVNLQTIPIDTNIKNIYNPLISLITGSRWTYHKDTPNYIFDDCDFCDLFFYNEYSVWLENCKGKCNKFEFNYTYIYKNPKIIIYRFNINLEGSINGDLMTLYDKNDKKYLFIRVK